jgi:hypothetical protein
MITMMMMIDKKDYVKTAGETLSHLPGLPIISGRQIC